MYRQIVAICMSVDLLGAFDLVHVREHVGRCDPSPLGQPSVDGRLARVVGGERQSLVPVLVDELAEVPGAVADVDVRVVEVRHLEARAAGPVRNRLAGYRLDLHQTHRTDLGERVRAKAALLVDHGGDEGGVQTVARRVCTDEVAVVERVLDPVDEGWALDRRLAEDDGGPGGDDRDGEDDQDAAGVHRRSSSRTWATNASSSSSEPSLT